MLANITENSGDTVTLDWVDQGYQGFHSSNLPTLPSTALMSVQKRVSCSPKFLALSPDDASGLYDFLAFLTVRFGHVTEFWPRRRSKNIIACGRRKHAESCMGYTQKKSWTNTKDILTTHASNTYRLQNLKNRKEVWNLCNPWERTAPRLISTVTIKGQGG